MKKSTFRKIFIVLLLMSNGFFIYRSVVVTDDLERRPRNKIIEKLHFDDSQVLQYDKLIRIHHSQIDIAERKLQKKKQLLYANLDEPFSESTLNDILKIESEIQRINFNHFKDIKKLCKPHQKRYFKALNREISSLFSPHKKGPKQ